MKTFITFYSHSLKFYDLYVIIISNSFKFVKGSGKKLKMSKIKLPESIKMIITDFDGIVTDNCVYINEDFTMSRKLNFKDVMGFRF